MGTAIFMVLMVCGYWYTSRDLSTRFKIKRSFGWDVYFLVALYGCIFVLQGVIATGLLWLLLFAPPPPTTRSISRLQNMPTGKLIL